MCDARRPASPPVRSLSTHRGPSGVWSSPPVAPPRQRRTEVSTELFFGRRAAPLPESLEVVPLGETRCGALAVPIGWGTDNGKAGPPHTRRLLSARMRTAAYASSERMPRDDTPLTHRPQRARVGERRVRLDRASRCSPRCPPESRAGVPRPRLAMRSASRGVERHGAPSAPHRLSAQPNRAGKRNSGARLPRLDPAVVRQADLG